MLLAAAAPEFAMVTFIGTLTLLAVLASATFTQASRQNIAVSMNSTWTMLDLNVILGTRDQAIFPVGQLVQEFSLGT